VEGAAAPRLASCRSPRACRASDRWSLANLIAGIGEVANVELGDLEHATGKVTLV